MTENHGLRVGDEVAIASYAALSGRAWSIHKVVKITPSGQLKLDGGTVLNPDLSIRGADKCGPFRAEIVTPAIREAVERIALLQQISRVSWRSKSTGQLRRIVAILKEENPK